MKIAVVSASFGGKDTQKPFFPQSVECDHYFFTEANSPVPLPNLPDRLKAKYFKLQMHRVFPGYDAYVWIDANVEVTSPDFVKVMTEILEYDDIAIQRHHERETIKEEIDFILASDNVYLTTRYGDQPLKEEYGWYLGQGMPESARLFSCNIFAYNVEHIPHETANTVLFFDEWWRLCLIWSWFDQSAFSFLIWSWYNNIAFNAKQLNFGPMFNNPYFTLHSHTKPLG